LPAPLSPASNVQPQERRWPLQRPKFANRIPLCPLEARTREEPRDYKVHGPTPNSARSLPRVCVCPAPAAQRRVDRRIFRGNGPEATRRGVCFPTYYDLTGYRTHGPDVPTGWYPRSLLTATTVPTM